MKLRHFGQASSEIILGFILVFVALLKNSFDPFWRTFKL